MSKLRILTCSTFLVLGLFGVATAQEDDSFLTGTTEVGGHYIGREGTFNRVGEYISFENTNEVLPDYNIDLFGGTESLMSQIKLLYRDQTTNSFGLDLNTNSYIRAKANYQSFVHNLDHDLMTNLQAREMMPNGNPGGKQVYYTDNDPLGRYSIEYRRFDSLLEVDLPFVDGGKVYGRFHDQRRQGHRQEMSISHCAFCHVEGDRREVNNQFKTWRTGIDGAVGKLAFNYEFLATDYTDYTTAPNTQYDRAMHPVRGALWTDPDTGNIVNYGEEFGSRLIFHDVTLPYNLGPSKEKRGHHVGAKLDLPVQSVLQGAYTYTRKTNTYTGLKGTFDSWVASWVAKPSQKTRLKARFQTYTTKVDDAFVDLPLYRDGRGGGGQDFDWTRISAANRQVVQLDLDAGYRFSKGGYLKLLYRHKQTDRDAMAQSQTNYVNDNGTNVMIPSTPYANKTTMNKFKLLGSKRVSRQSHVVAYIDYTTYENPFMNPTAMCEPGMHGTDYNLAGNSLVWYFQRMREGNASNRPSSSLSGSIRGSHQLSNRTSLSAFFTGATEKNDKLNSYEFNRDIVQVGGTLWWAPTDWMPLTLGFAHNNYKSNAKLCPPIFDG
jgi:hypothetical protein